MTHYCLSCILDSNGSCSNAAVLGASAMVGFDVIFDVENKRVGFAESDCGTPSLVKMSKLTTPDVVLRCGALQEEAIPTLQLQLRSLQIVPISQHLLLRYQSTQTPRSSQHPPTLL